MKISIVIELGLLLVFSISFFVLFVLSQNSGSTGQYLASMSFLFASLIQVFVLFVQVIIGFKLATKSSGS